MKKRGSHVGVVISFMIFIMFLIFLYLIIEPKVRIEKNKQSDLDNLKIELIEKISANMTSVTVSDSSSGYNCLKLDNIAVGGSGLNSIVKNKEGNPVNSYSSGDFLKIALGGESFFKVHYSEEEFKDFPTSNNNCVDAIIESVRTDKHIFETKIIVLKEEYENGYDDLKEKLKVPAESEFGFSFIYSNETIIGTKEGNISISIYTEKVSIHYIDKEANINPGLIIIKVW